MHGHFHLEDDKAEEEINAKYKDNMRDRIIKTVPFKEKKDD